MKNYYHFTNKTLRNSQPIPPIGEWVTHEGSLIPCESGLHASEHPFDALQYAPGPFLHLVELGDKIIPHGDPVDKVVSNKRKILKTIDATNLLREFARWCALQVIDQWQAPPVVREYLQTGDKSIRAAAELASRSVTELAAWSAAESAARSAARLAAWLAAQSSAQLAASLMTKLAAGKTQREKFLELVTQEFNRA